MQKRQIEIANELDRVQKIIVDVADRNSFAVAVDASQVRYKGHGTSIEAVTELDLEISHDLLVRIRVCLPGSYSEEDLPAEPVKDDSFWQIDPLDGTDELIQGQPHFSGISAALLEKQLDTSYGACASILYLPLKDIMIIADSAAGKVTLLQGGIASPVPASDRAAVRGWIRQIDPNEAVTTYYEELGRKLNLPVEIVQSGGAVHAFVSLVLGEINVLCFNYDYSKEWDTSAAEPVVALLGGFLSDLRGRSLNYNRIDHFNRDGFLASLSFGLDELLPEHPNQLLIRRNEVVL